MATCLPAAVDPADCRTRRKDDSLRCVADTRTGQHMERTVQMKTSWRACQEGAEMDFRVFRMKIEDASSEEAFFHRLLEIHEIIFSVTLNSK